MGEVLAVRDAYRAQEWAMLIQECSASGLTKREFCQQRGLSEKSLPGVTLTAAAYCKHFSSNKTATRRSQEQRRLYSIFYRT